MRYYCKLNLLSVIIWPDLTQSWHHLSFNKILRDKNHRRLTIIDAAWLKGSNWKVSHVNVYNGFIYIRTVQWQKMWMQRCSVGFGYTFRPTYILVHHHRMQNARNCIRNIVIIISSLVICPDLGTFRLARVLW